MRRSARCCRIAGSVDAPYLAGMTIVDAVAHAEWPRGDEVSRADADTRAGHRCVGKPHREQRLDFHAHRAGGLLDADQRGVIGNAQAAGVFHLDAAGRQLALDLRARAVHQDQLDAEAVQQCDIVNQPGEVRILNGLATEYQHEGAAAVRMYIRRGVPEAVDELPVMFAAFHGDCYSKGSVSIQTDLIIRRSRSTVGCSRSSARYSSGWWACSILPGPRMIVSMPSCFR